MYQSKDFAHFSAYFSLLFGWGGRLPIANTNTNRPPANTPGPGPGPSNYGIGTDRMSVHMTTV